MRHAQPTQHRPMYVMMALTAVLGALVVGVVLLVSDGNPPGYYPEDAAYGAPAAAPSSTAAASPTAASPTAASPTASPTAGGPAAGSPNAVPAPDSTPGAGTAPTTPPAAPPAADPLGPPGAGASGTAPAAVRVATRGSGRLLAATLTGDVEVPGPGDPDGVGVAAIRVSSTGRVCLEAVVTGVQPITKVHIHRGTRGVAGPVAVEFAVTGPTATASCTTVDRALAGRIRGNPENWYVNVHTAAFAQGALRGQLMW